MSSNLDTFTFIPYYVVCKKNKWNDQIEYQNSDLGVAFMPDMTVVDEIRNGRLVRLDWTVDDFPIYSQVFIHKDKRMTGAIEGFLRLIEA